MVPALREGQSLGLEPVGRGKLGMVPTAGTVVGGVGSRQSDRPESIGTERLARIVPLAFHPPLPGAETPRASIREEEHVCAPLHPVS
jgi:hypothetical protein